MTPIEVNCSLPSAAVSALIVAGFAAASFSEAGPPAPDVDQWPAIEQDVYSAERASSSYRTESSYSVGGTKLSLKPDFGAIMSEFFLRLSASQQAIPREIGDILNTHASSLYES